MGGRSRRAIAALLVAGGVLWACTGEDGATGPTTGPEGDLASIEVTIRVLGADLDVDGFRLEVDAVPLGHSLLDTTLTLEVEPGDRELLLGDVAGNCEVQDDNPRVVTSSGGGTMRTDFDVSCQELPSLGGEIVAAVWHHPVARPVASRPGQANTTTSEGGGRPTGSGSCSSAKSRPSVTRRTPRSNCGSSGRTVPVSGS